MSYFKLFYSPFSIDQSYEMRIIAGGAVQMMDTYHIQPLPENHDDTLLNTISLCPNLQGDYPVVILPVFLALLKTGDDRITYRINLLMRSIKNDVLFLTSRNKTILYSSELFITECIYVSLKRNPSPSFQLYFSPFTSI